MGVKSICTDCELCLNISHQIPGQGSTKPTILFVFDHPTKTQDENHDIFAGRNFKKVKALLQAHGIFEYSYYTHLMKCRPPMIETWDYQRIELASNLCSSTHFAKEFGRVGEHVKVIVPVGKFAYQMMTTTKYLKYDDYLNLLNLPQQVDRFTIIPIHSIGTLIKGSQLNHAILGVKNYYATNYNYNLLLKKK